VSRGRFITIEGGEGAGKSTQVGRLAEALRARGHAVATTREPGGSPSAEAIRTLLLHGPDGQWTPMAEALLHYAARCEHVTALIEPALAAGTWVVSDRFADSTMAYQGYGLGLGPEAIAGLDRLALGGFRPDLTLVLDLPVEVGLARARGRGEADRYERMDVAFHHRLREGFLAIARGDPGRCAVIPADDTPGAVHRAILAELDRRLGTIAR
jgi:dTMP kinase